MQTSVRKGCPTTTNPSTIRSRLQTSTRNQSQINEQSTKSHSGSIREKRSVPGPLQIVKSYVCFAPFGATLADVRSHCGTHWIFKGSPNRSFFEKFNINEKNNDTQNFNIYIYIYRYYYFLQNTPNTPNYIFSLYVFLKVVSFPN